MFALAHHSCVNHFAIIFSVLALLTICTSAVVSPTQPQSKSHSSSFTFSQSATSSAVTITAPSSASTSLTASSTSTSSVADSTSTSESTTISQSLSHSSTAEKTSSTTKSTTLTGTTSLTGSTTMSNDVSRSRSTSATSSSSRSASPTRSRSAEAASTTQSVSRTPSSTITESPVASFTPSSSMTPSLEPTSSPSNTATPIPPPTRSNTRSTTVSQSVSRTSSSSPSVALSRSITLSTSNTPTLSITSSSSLTAEFSRSKSVSSTASLSSSITKSFNITKSEASFSVSVTKSLTPSGRSASSILSLTSSPVKTRSMNSSTVSNSISVTQLVSHSITISASPSASVSHSRSLTGTLTGSTSTTMSGGTRSVTPSSATSASLTQPPTRTRTLALTRSLTLSSTISNPISVSVSGSVSLTLTESNSLSLSQSLTHQVTFTTSLTPSMTTSMSNSSLLSGSESTSSSQSRDVTSSVSDTKSQNVSSSRGSSTVSLSITLSMSQSTSPSSTPPQSHSDSITRTVPTISGSSTGNITGSNLVTKSVSESEQGSATKSPTSSLSVSFSVSVSRSLSKMLSASLASVSGSGSVSSTANVSATDSRDPTTTATTTVTDRRTISFSPEETMSKSKSQITLTQTESNERSRTRTQPTSSKTFEHPITTSVPLIWRETGTLRFLRRPTRYAAPFRPIPIAPTLIFQLRGLAAIGEQIYKSPVGLWCYMKITSVATRQDSSQPWENIAQNNSRFFGVWLQGLRTFPMVQSVCTFPNFNFQVPLARAFDEQRQTGDVFQLTTEYLVGVSFCANTSKMIDPRVPVHPCNSSLFHVAACPYTSEAVYAVTTNPSPLLMRDVVGLNGTVNLQAPPYASIFASNRSGNGKLVLELVGGSFEYSTLRNSYSCALTDDVEDLYGNYTVSGRHVYSADSYLIDMCHLRCIFDESSWSTLALFPSTNVTTTSGWDTHRMASSALLAKVELLDHAIPVPSTCTGDSRRIPLASLEQPGMKDVTSELLSCTAINQPHTVTVSQYQQAGSTASSVSLQNTTTRIVDFVPTSCFLRVIGSLEPRKFLVQSSRVANDAPITLRKNQTSVEGMVVYVGLCDAAGNAYPINLLNVTMNSTVRFVNVAITSTMSVAGAAVTVPGVNVTSQIVGSYGIVMNVVDDGPIFLFENLQLPTPPFGADGAASGCNTPNSWTVPSTATSLSTRGSTGASITNVTIGSSYRTPLVLFPSSIFGMPLYAPVCVSVVVGEVTGIVLLNADAIMRITDTASSLYVTPILSITDALGNAINSTSAITIAFPMNLSVVVIQPTSTSTAQREFSTLTTNSSEEIVVVNGVACEVVSAIPPVVYVGVTTFPFALTGVVVSQPGANFSIWVRGTQHSSASLITGVTVNVSTVLWETTTQSSNTPAFPLLLANYSITSSFCPAGSGISTPFSVEQLIYVANSNPCPGNMGTTNISYNNTFPTVGGDTIIRGSGFSYFRASTMRCHLSNWNQLFSASAAATGADPPGASKVTFVSSCEVRCTLPAQPYPINPSSSFAYNSQGQLVRSSTVSTNQVGQFRLRGGPLQWSSPSIALRVVGPPRQMDVRGWSTTLQNSLLLVIPTFSVVMLDATGSDLTGLDFSTVFRSRTITLSYTPSSSGQLNGTSAISVSATTCSPYNGVAVFDPISIAPTSGEYSLTLDGRQLTEYVLLLTIVDNVTLDHNLKLLSPFPLCFVSVTLDRQSTLNGLFPVPVLIGAFRRNTSLDTNSVDTAVTNVRIFAQVTRDPDSPLPSFYDGSLVELGVDLDDCNNDYGNCGYLDAGVLTFSSFRFTGIPGVWYLIMIRPQNASLALSNASFKVRVPYCPVNVTTGNLTAQIQTLNNSLTLPSGGLAVKGWQFTIPGAMQTANSIVNFMSSCVVGDSAFIPNGTSANFQQPPVVSSGALRCTISSSSTNQQLSLPGIFYDYCTARCFAQDAYTTDPRWQTENPAAVCGASSSTSNVGGCCFNVTSNAAQCSQPLTVSVSVGVAQSSSITSSVATTAVGTFTFIGPAEGVEVIANIQATKTVFTTAQIVPSKALTTLDTVMVALIDTEGERLGMTIGNITGVAWTAGYLYPKDLTTSPLVVPGNYTDQLYRTLLPLEATVAASNTTDPSMMCLPLRQSQTELLFLNGTRTQWVHNTSRAPDDSSSSSSLSAAPPTGAMTWPVVNGEASITNLALELPAVGYFSLPIYVASQGRLYTVNATVYVTPGTPVRVCLATSFANSQIGNNELLDPQPLIYLRDLAGNIYQSLRSNQVIFAAVSQYNYLMFDSVAINANISLDYQQRVASAANASLYVWSHISLTSTTTTDLTPTAEYGGGIDVVQYLFNGLKVPAVHSVVYRLLFLSYSLKDNVTSELLLIKPCDSTQFAIQGDATCYTCPRGLGESCIGGSTGDCFQCDGSTSMNVTTNYWRYSASSEYAYACPASSCLGNTETGTCVDGYLESSLNPLCGACETGFAQDFLGKCVECAPTGVTIFVVVLLMLVIIIVVFAFIYLSVKGAITDDENDNHLVMMLKIFMNYAQVAGMLGEFKVNFTGLVLGYFNFVGAAVGGSGVSISPVNCLFPHLTFLDKMSAQLVMPVVVLLAVAASLGILHLRRVRKMARLEREAHQSLVALQQVLITSADDELLEEQGLWQDVNAQDPTRAGSFLMNESSSNRGSNQQADAEVIRSTQLAANNMMLHTVPKKKVRNHVPFRQVFGNASMILIFVFYQTILTQSIQTFNCVTLLIGRSGNTSSLTVLDVDVLVTCSGEAYENGLAIAMYGVFIYAIFLPLFTMTFVLHQARNIGWTATYHQFSFLIRGFRLKYWYWEFVIVFRKTGLRLLIATVNDSTLQALLGIWFLTALFVLQTYTQPYVLALHNHADQLSIMTALITLNIGLAFSTFSDSCNIVCGVFSVLLVVCNIAVIVFLAVQLGWGFYLRLVEEFGIDTADGSRRISMRNLKNILFVLLKRQHQMSPSFRTYAPRPLNRALAKSVLGRDAGTDSDDDGKEEGDEDDTVTQQSGSVTGTYQPPPLLQNQRDSDADESEEKPADEIIDPYQAFPLDHASEGSTTTNTSDEVEMQAIHPHLRRGSTMGPPRQDYSFLHVTVPQDESPRIRGGEEGGEALESDPLNLFGRRR